MIISYEEVQILSEVAEYLDEIVDTCVDMIEEEEAEGFGRKEVKDVLQRLCYDVNVHIRASGCANLCGAQSGSIDNLCMDDDDFMLETSLTSPFGECDIRSRQLARYIARAESILRFETTRPTYISSRSPSSDQSLARLGTAYARNALEGFDLILSASRFEMESAEAALRKARVNTVHIVYTESWCEENADIRRLALSTKQ